MLNLLDCFQLCWMIDLYFRYAGLGGLRPEPRFTTGSARCAIIWNYGSASFKCLEHGDCVVLLAHAWPSNVVWCIGTLGGNASPAFRLPFLPTGSISPVPWPDQLADSFSLTRSTCWCWRITHGTAPASTVLKKVRCTVFTMHRLQFLVSVCVFTVQPTWHTAAARFDRWVRCLQAPVLQDDACNYRGQRAIVHGR